jgi:hypothetical protein
MAGKIELKAPLNGVVTLEPEDTASNFTVTIPATAATLLTDSAGVINIGSGQIYKDASGKVGFGNTSPAYIIDSYDTDRDYVRFSTDNITNGAIATGILFGGRNFSGDVANYASVEGHIQDRSTGSENGALVFKTSAAGSLAEHARFDASGNFLVGTTAPRSGSRIRVVTSASTNATYGVYIENASSEQLFYLEDGGTFSTGNAPSSPYNRTTGSAANVYVDSLGILFRSTSSLKYKTDIQDASFGLPDVLKLRPVTYKGINDGDKVFGGLIAEDVHDAGLTEFVQYADDGTPDALFYGNMVSLAFKAIQELKAELDMVKAELNTLKGN